MLLLAREASDSEAILDFGLQVSGGFTPAWEELLLVTLISLMIGFV